MRGRRVPTARASGSDVAQVPEKCLHEEGFNER